MKKVKIWFEGFWTGFNPEDNFILKILSKKFDVELSKNPDFVFSSCFNDNALKYDAVRIIYTGENFVPDFNLYDYGIGYSKLSFGDRYLRFPLYKLYSFEQDMDRIRSEIKRKDWRKRKFCAMVVSNPEGKERNVFHKKICRYKMCDSGGAFRNNVGGKVADKLKFLEDYRYSIAFENSSNPGYITEKIFQSFCAGTIPIYWGDPEVAEEFNSSAFINCHLYKTFDEVIEKIRYLEEHPEEEFAMIQSPIFTDAQREVQKKLERDLEEFLFYICKQSKRKAYRRNSLGGGWGKWYEEKAQTNCSLEVKLYTAAKRRIKRKISKIFIL